MTVIAFDGKTLAADKMTVDGSGLRRTVTKIERINDHLVAFAGSWDVATEMRAWWAAGAKPDDFPKSARDSNTVLVVIGPSLISTYNTGPYPIVFEDEKCAFGSGRDFALTAMHLGCDAEEAVHIACHFQSDCGNGIDALTL